MYARGGEAASEEKKSVAGGRGEPAARPSLREATRRSRRAVPRARAGLHRGDAGLEARRRTPSQRSDSAVRPPDPLRPLLSRSCFTRVSRCLRNFDRSAASRRFASAASARRRPRTLPQPGCRNPQPGVRAPVAGKAVLPLRWPSGYCPKRVRPLRAARSARQSALPHGVGLGERGCRCGAGPPFGTHFEVLRKAREQVARDEVHHRDDGEHLDRIVVKRRVVDHACPAG